MNQQNYPSNMNNQTILPTSTLAIVSLIAGILGFMGLPIIASIVAILTGYAARNETRSVPPRASGDGLATAGIVMGWIQIGLTVVAICCFAAYFVFVIGLVSRSR
jgi:magnesium-transporting ATPase (P-type)